MSAAKESGDGFAELLNTQPDFEVVGVAADSAEAVSIATECKPDVVIMDVRMPVMDGIGATRRLTALAEQAPRVLVLTTFHLDVYVYFALRAGASGFLLKAVTAERLIDAVRVIAAGEALLAPGVTRRLISEFADMSPVPEGFPAPAMRARSLESLTRRETEVLQLVAQGLSNLEIAACRACRRRR